MPLYEYRCEACGSTFEKIVKFSDPPLEVCEKCGKGPVQKLISSPAIQFKGSGWYITDYAKKSSSDGGGSTTKPGGEKADSGTKPDSSSSSAGDKTKSSTPKSD